MNQKTYNILQKNPKKNYEGSHYAIQATGGFQYNIDSPNITMQPLTQFGKYDFTNSLQILVKKERLNAKIGIFDIETEQFSEDSIQLSIDELQIDENDIISLGNIETVYLDFKKYIYDYFNMNKAIHIFNENMNILDRTDFYKMLNDIKGQIIIEDINSIMTTLSQLNICGNRENADKREGFIEGDLFFIKNGFSMIISLDCGLEKFYQFDMSIRLE
jgi:hypothetical protein